jgi:signal transduction histidine kinase
MKGSPVRGQQRLPNIKLNEAHDVQTFQAEIIRILGSEFKHVEVSFGILDTESKIVQLPTWIRSHLERQPGLHKKLEQGEMVGISAAEDNPVLRPAAAVHSSIVLVPLMSEGRLVAAIGLVSPLDGPQLSAEDLETTRQLAYDAAPILLRLQELDALRRQNRELTSKTEQVARAVKEVPALTEEKNMLVAMLQMHCHQQVNLAHELRTPLAAIRGYTRMIVDGRSGETNEKQKEYLRIVTDNTNRLITLVSWMSYVADLSAHHLKLSSFDFRELWNESVNLSEQQLAEKQLKLTREISEERSVIIGDREKLAFVLQELITVAARLADAGETIVAAISHGRDGELIFKLSARGTSISPGVLSTMFDRTLNTVANSTAQNKESSVINLSGVYDIVGMHGGRIFVNNTGEEGATFLFTLPAITASEEKSHEQAVNSSRRRR